MAGVAPTPELLAHARRLVLHHGSHPTVYQILNPGMRLWAARDRTAVAGYVDRPGVRVVAGDPVGPAGALQDTIEELTTAAQDDGRRVCFLGADAELVAAVSGSEAWSAITVGAQPIVDPGDWASTLERHASLRAQLHRAHNKDVSVAPWTPDMATGHPALRRCLDDWLGARGLPPLHFLVEPDILGDLEDRRVFVATRGEAVCGFLVLSPIPARKGWHLELLVRAVGAPNGTTECLVAAALEAFAGEGVSCVALGAAPLSRRAPPVPGTPRRLMALLAWQRAHGRRFYNFAGLERYKEKFWPAVWEPVYAVSQEPRFSLGTLYAIAGAYCAGSPLLTMTRALARAGRQELQWLWRRTRYSAQREAM